jgi:hypothetical protein
MPGPKPAPRRAVVSRLGRLAVGCTLAFATASAPAVANAATPFPGAATPAGATPSPCPRSLKFGGSLYLDTDVSVPTAEVGPQVGETEPNPAQCALPDRLNVFRHNGNNSTDEVVYYLNPQTPELVRSAGQTGFPGSTLVKVLVLILVIGIIVYAAIPAILGHMRQPPIGVGPDDTDWIDDVKADADSTETPPGRDPR